MTRFLHWRKMTWVLLIWTVAMAAVLVTFGPVLALFVGVLGFATLSVLWFMSRPLWRRGHGARFRRLEPAEVKFKSVEGLAAPSHVPSR
jgi:Zn-dependent protease with chaperone function